MELAKAKATVLGLRSQRDVLKARMKAVEVQRRGEGTAPFALHMVWLEAEVGCWQLPERGAGLERFTCCSPGRSLQCSPQGVTPAPGVTKDLEALFDGKTLDGWRIEGALRNGPFPMARSKAAGRELACWCLSGRSLILS